MALELVIGPDRFRDAVDWCVAGWPGSELARLALEHVKPPSAGDRCIEIFRSDKELEHQLAAVSVLRLVSVNRQLSIVKDLFDHPHPTIQEDGAAILESLVDSRLQGDPDPEPFITLAEGHFNDLVRQRAQKIRSEWADWP